MTARRGAAGRPASVGRRAIVALTILSLLGLAALSGPVAGRTPAGAVGVSRDGLTAETAAPSCWSVKQSYADSTDGVYWLWTPKLVEPQQFYCDMTTDGGGWVLVGRGREGWSFPYWGQGSPSTVRSPVSGSAAFAPATLPTPTVDGLMNGGRMDGLTDGIRLRRATNAAGTSWQEVRMRVKTFGTWSWAFGGGIPLSSIKFDNTTTTLSTSFYQTNTTSNTQVANDTRRVTTFPMSGHNFRAGFSFGSAVSTGSNAATSYLWEFANENSAIPFTQVFIRPTTTDADIVAAGVTHAPDSGLAGSTVRKMLDRTPVAQGWAVTGLNPGTAVPNMDDYVKTIAQIGNTIYLGGKFLQVQHGIGGPDVHAVVPGRVQRQHRRVDPGLPPGDRRAGVEDRGVARRHEAVRRRRVHERERRGQHDRARGARPRDGRARRRHQLVGLRLAPDGFVRRARHVHPGPVALPGRQLHHDLRRYGQQLRRPAHAQPPGSCAPDRRPPRLELDTDARDGTHGHQRQPAGRPRVRRRRVLDPERRDAQPQPPGRSIDTATGAAVHGLKPWVPSSAGTPDASNAILEVGNHVYQGGSQHYLQSYARGDYSFERGFITQNTGGDYQALATRDGIVYGSCHCVTDYQYEDTTRFPTPQGYTRVDPINLIGAYDMTNNLEVVPEFHPTQLATAGDGPWALFFDTNGCMWAGGDLVRPGASAIPYYGGYEKFCGRDATAPTIPGNSHAALNGNDVTLTWNASTDNAATPIHYEILKDDPAFGTIVMASTFERTFTDTNVVNPSRYYIRAVDDQGNRSATTAVLAVTPPPPAVATLLAHGASWSYRADGQDLGTAWRQPAFNSSSWATGASQLGWGGKGETTVTASGAITSYFVRHQSIANPGLYKTITIRLKRDDGAVVYVNGVPVVRDNMPAGTLTAATLASSFVSGASETTWFEHQVPASLFKAGDNTIAAEVHQGRRQQRRQHLRPRARRPQRQRDVGPDGADPDAGQRRLQQRRAQLEPFHGQHRGDRLPRPAQRHPGGLHRGDERRRLRAQRQHVVHVPGDRDRQLGQRVRTRLARGVDDRQQRAHPVGRDLVLPLDRHRPRERMAPTRLQRIVVGPRPEPARLGQPGRGHGGTQRDDRAVLHPARERGERRHGRSAHAPGQARRRDRRLPQRHRDPARQPARRNAHGRHVRELDGERLGRNRLEDLHDPEHRARHR